MVNQFEESDFSLEKIELLEPEQVTCFQDIVDMRLDDLDWENITMEDLRKSPLWVLDEWSLNQLLKPELTRSEYLALHYMRIVTRARSQAALDKRNQIMSEAVASVLEGETGHSIIESKMSHWKLLDDYSWSGTELYAAAPLYCWIFMKNINKRTELFDLFFAWKDEEVKNLYIAIWLFNENGLNVAGVKRDV